MSLAGIIMMRNNGRKIYLSIFLLDKFICLWFFIRAGSKTRFGDEKMSEGMKEDILVPYQSLGQGRFDPN